MVSAASRPREKCSCSSIAIQLAEGSISRLRTSCTICISTKILFLICVVEAPLQERNANRFASALLMSREGILSSISGEEITAHTVNIATVLRMEHLFGVSRSTLLIRLKDMGLITSARYEALCGLPVKETAREWGYDSALYEPGNDGIVVGDFGEKARMLFENGIISEGHYNELMNMLYGDDGEEN